jgi:hypothetical protein
MPFMFFVLWLQLKSTFWQCGGTRMAGNLVHAGSVSEFGSGSDITWKIKK